MNVIVREMLAQVHEAEFYAERYEELLDAWDPETCDAIEYENYYNSIDRIWQQLDESRELGEDGLEENDEILDCWEKVHQKACEIYTQIQKSKIIEL